MPRRRPEPPLADRLAAVLGIPSAALFAPAVTVVPSPESPEVTGWLPKRPSLISTHPVSAPAVSTQRPRHRRPAPPMPAILTVPSALRGVRARPRRLAVLGILVLLVVLAMVFGVRVALARSAAQPRPIAAAARPQPGGLVARTVPAAFATAGAAGLPTAASVLLVHVVGQVRHPGVVRLRPGARVLDAVEAAGGLLPTADTNGLNLARPVADGEQILVPKPGQNIPAGASGGTGAGAGGGATGQGAGAGAGSVGGLVDLNTADLPTLESLPGVGPVLAQRIMDWRTEHGRFSSVDEIGEVSGIGDKLLAQIGPKVRI